MLFTGKDALDYRTGVSEIYEETAGKSGKISHSAVEHSIQVAILRALDPGRIAEEADFARRLESALEMLWEDLQRKPVL